MLGNQPWVKLHNVLLQVPASQPSATGLPVEPSEPSDDYRAAITDSRRIEEGESFFQQWNYEDPKKLMDKTCEQRRSWICDNRPSMQYWISLA